MRKNLIALSAAALVAGMAGSASAGVIVDNGPGTTSPTDATNLAVVPGGTGHILMLPYFTSQGTNATLINLVNTDVTNGKAVKIRFRGASNSDDIFDFQVYLSPGDVWTAKVGVDSTGASRLDTGDKSCTLPPSVNAPFVLDRLPPSFTAAQKQAQTREGYVEFLVMADIPPFGISTVAGAEGTPLATANALYTAIKHVNGVAPCTPATLAPLINDITTLNGAYAQGFRAPSGGIFVNYTIVDVVNTGSYTGEATAVVATNAADPITLQALPARGNIVFFPQTGATAPTPDLFTADPSLRTVFGVNPGEVQTGAAAPTAYANGTNTAPIIPALMFDFPDLSTPYIVPAAGPLLPIFQANQLTNAIATRFIRNEVFTDASVNATTDWAFSMPTRRYHVAMDYRGATPLRAFTNHGQLGLPAYFTASNTSVLNSQICVASGGLAPWGREEQTTTSGFVISPGTSTTFQLCGEATVLSFNAGGVGEASVLSAAIARSDAAVPQRDGWVQISTPGTADAGGLNGLPVIGKAFMRATVPSGRFGMSFEHRYGR